MITVIFGAGGQDGRLLTALLERQRYRVIGVSRKRAAIRGDVSDGQFVDKLLRQHKPAFIFQFAANSSTQHETLHENHAAISTGTLNVLESARKHCPQARIFIPGSALQFKNTGIPIDEKNDFEASSPYALARVHATYASRYYRSTFEMNIFTGYLFHHDSPFRSENHLSKKIVSAAHRIGRGSSEILRIGDPEAEKEFNYAGDIVEAMWLLVNQDEVREAVIGCGECHSIRKWIELCFKRVGKDWQDHLSIDPNFRTDFKKSVSDPTRMHSLGWKPKIGIEQLADIMMADNDRCV